MGGMGTHNDANSETDSPDAVGCCAIVSSDDDQGDNTGSDETGDNGSVRGNGDKQTSTTSHRLRAISALNSLGGANGVFASGTHTSNTATDDHHPEHALDTGAVGGGRDDDTLSWSDCQLLDKWSFRLTRTRKAVVRMMPILRPNLSMQRPNKIIPKMSPIRIEFDNWDLMLEVMTSGYLIRCKSL